MQRFLKPNASPNPFRVSFIETKARACYFCSFLQKYNTSKKDSTKCEGCGIPEDRTDKIKHLLNVINSVIHIQWLNPERDYQDLEVENHRTATELL